MSSSIEIQTETMTWESAQTPGVFYKSLRYDKATKSGAVLVRMEANTDYPEHVHTNGEDFLVLEGELIIGEKRFSKGSYVYSPPQSVHHPRTDQGALLFAVFHGKIAHTAR